uniref:ELKS/Rab6-interacting/CAST family member 1-like n=1 Tax=Petromyzon marinus TaxID=7757 RepID=A0AAJ7T559_PETMA|nr:ELKS/Rab6-interacting/CAST family member 1-like [Petromyzon marinus]
MFGSGRSLGQSPARSPRLPRSPRLGHRRAGSTGDGAGSGRTLSMENIQSLNAAYATSGPMYLGEHDMTGLHASPLPVKSVVTLGRGPGALQARLSYGGRVTTMGSSPNIAAASGQVEALHAALGELAGPGGLGLSMHHHHHQQQQQHVVRPGAQGQLKELLCENEALRRELDAKDNKLGSSMNSIKTFWSPELKRERALRKEEAARIAMLREQLRVAQDEHQTMQMTVHALQEELRCSRDLTPLFSADGRARCSGPGGSAGDLPSEESVQRLRAEHERQAKELYLLRQTLEEMELRIETQKQTLGSRDESIRKLLDMIQEGGGVRSGGGSSGVGVDPLCDEGDGGTTEGEERARHQLADADAQISRLQLMLEQRERENQQCRECWVTDSHVEHGHHHDYAPRIHQPAWASMELHRRADLGSDTAKTKALQTVIEMKDTKIASLERTLRDLEDEIQTLRSSGALSLEERQEELKQMEVYKSHSKFMKSKIDQLKGELSRKDTEQLGLQTKLETLTNQNSDNKQHIEVLKESLAAKEQRAAILQAEVEALRARLEEKESMVARKVQQVQELAEEKGSLGGEIRDFKDMMEVKERKINVLQKKIENLQEQLRDKEKQISSLRERVKSLQADSSNADTALATLEEALSDKERIIDRMKQQREQEDRDKHEEAEAHRRESKGLKERVNTLLAELTDKECALQELKQYSAALASVGMKKEARLKALEAGLEGRREDLSRVEAALKKGGEEASLPEQAERLRQLESEQQQQRAGAMHAAAETQRLLDTLGRVEAEERDKDARIAELERLLKEQNKKSSNLKQRDQVEKRRGVQEDPRRRENVPGESPQLLQDALRRREERIEELEEALRQSASATSERDLALAQEEAGRSAAHKQRRGPLGPPQRSGYEPTAAQVEELQVTLERCRHELEATRSRLGATQQALRDRETHLASLRAERRRQLEEVLEMKQEALLAAISEKDANIALLELSSSSSSKKKKALDEVGGLRQEKDRLVQQLKQQTQNRMKLMADNYDDDYHQSLGRGPVSNQGPSPDQDDEEGIWA